MYRKSNLSDPKNHAGMTTFVSQPREKKPMARLPLLEVKDLSIEFISGKERICAVDHISFDIMPGETLAVVGESGSGKTVTALSVMQLVPSPPGIIREGALLYRNGKGIVTNLSGLSEERLKGIRGKEISMIFQEPMTSLNPVYTCGDQVAESLGIHLGIRGKTARAKVIELFREVLLPQPEEILKVYPHQLSGGQKQRVMIAMAVACNPGLLIADEPTTALDVTVQKAILGLMKRMQATRGMSILFITHDLGLVAGFADRVVVMTGGRIVEQGPVTKIFSAPEHPYTRGLLACRPPLDRRLERLPTLDDFVNTTGLDVPAEITTVQREKAHEKYYAQQPVLVFEGISKKFASRGGIFSSGKNTFTALEKITLEIYPGETLGIVGESGSGKTTLARVALDLIPATEGRIRFNGIDITRLSREKLKALRKSLQIIFQDPYSSLNPRMTIGNAILEPMVVHRMHGDPKTRREKVVELLVRVGLAPEHFNRYPHEFSGGQRQRICIARALATEPHLIICDESVSALDVSVQAQVLNLLNDLKRDFGLTYLFISHDLSVVKYMADRLIVMKNGKIVEAGEADAVYAHPRSEYTRALLNAIPGQADSRWT